MPLPVWNCQITVPDLASYALKLPFGSPANTRSPAVVRIDETIGCCPRHDHTSRPVAASNAFTCPHWPLFGRPSTSFPLTIASPPQYGSDSLKRLGISLNVPHASTTGAERRQIGRG